MTAAVSTPTPPSSSVMVTSEVEVAAESGHWLTVNMQAIGILANTDMIAGIGILGMELRQNNELAVTN